MRRLAPSDVNKKIVQEAINELQKDVFAMDHWNAVTRPKAAEVGRGTARSSYMVQGDIHYKEVSRGI